ncbi:hypothetical protein WA158_007456 [Blastocystis sp. Blastoise]
MSRILLEFRIPLPFSAEDAKQAYPYGNTVALKRLYDFHCACDWSISENFDNSDGSQEGSPVFNLPIPQMKGQYDYKVTDMASMYPAFVIACVPGHQLTCEEECYTSLPYIEAWSSSKLVGTDRFTCKIKTLFKDDLGTEDNVFNLSEDELEKRSIEFRDINQHHSTEKVNPVLDIKNFKCTKRGFGPLPEDWIENSCIPSKCTMYRLIDIKFNLLGLSTIISTLLSNQHKQYEPEIARDMVRTMDEWIDMTDEDIKRIETECRETLKEQSQKLKK